jgi:hypothetical protein
MPIASVAATFPAHPQAVTTEALKEKVLSLSTAPLQLWCSLPAHQVCPLE